MGKICAVKNCGTGQYLQFKQRKELGLWPLALFGVPKCPTKRRLWNEVIGRALTDQEYLCELHFNDADINRINDYGESRTRCRLRKNAKPMAINGNDKKEIDGPEIDSAIDFALPAAEEPAVNDQLPVTVKDNIATESEYDGFADHLLLSDQEDASMRDKVPEDNEDPAVPGADIFTIHDVAAHFNSHPMRQSWSWTINPRRPDRIVFSHVDPASGNVRVHLDVESDLSLKLRTPDEKVRQEIDHSVYSVQDIVIALKRMEITPMCGGTGFEANSRSTHCLGIVNDDDYSKNVREKRCPSCRHFRRTLQNRVNRKKTATGSTRYLRSKSIRHREHQQMTRLQRKIFWHDEKRVWVERLPRPSSIYPSLPPPLLILVGKAAKRGQWFGHGTLGNAYGNEIIHGCIDRIQADMVG